MEREGKRPSQARKGPGFKPEGKRPSQTRKGPGFESEGKRWSTTYVTRSGARRAKVRDLAFRAKDLARGMAMLYTQVRARVSARTRVGDVEMHTS